MIPLLPEMPLMPTPKPAGVSGSGALALTVAGPGGAADFASLLDTALPPEPPAATAAALLPTAAPQVKERAGTVPPSGPLHDEETEIAAGTVRLSIFPAKSESGPVIRLPTGRILPQAGASLPPARVPDAAAADRAVLIGDAAPTAAGDADAPAPGCPLPLEADAPDPMAPILLPVSQATPAAVTAPAGLAPDCGEMAEGEPTELPSPAAMPHPLAQAVPEDAPGTAAELEPEPAPCAFAPTPASEPFADRPDDADSVPSPHPTAPVPGFAPTPVVAAFERPVAAPPASMPPEASAKPVVSPATVVPQVPSVSRPTAIPPVALPAEASLGPATVPPELLRFAPAAPPSDAGEMPVAALRTENPAHSPLGLSIPTPALPDAPPVESAAGSQLPNALSAPSVPTAPLLFAASSPPPAAATLVEPQAETPAAAPQQQSTIDQVGDLREAMRAQRPAMVLNHAEFGAVSMRLEAGGSEGWRAVLASRDPGFVPAIQQALAERAVAAAASPDTGLSSGLSAGQQGASHNGTGEPRSGTSPSGGQGGSQPYFGQSGPRDGEAAPDHRRPSTAAALAARTEAEDGGSAGSTPQSGGLFA